MTQGEPSGRKPEGQVTLCPTLVIGLGGTGTEVVRRTKRHFRQMWRPTSSGYDPDQQATGRTRGQGSECYRQEIPGIVQVLAIDTEPLANLPDSQYLHNSEYTYLGGFNAARLLQSLNQRPEIQEWWADAGPVSAGRLRAGTGQFRRLGRLAFFRNYVAFKEDLMKKATRLGSLREQEAIQERGFGLAPERRLVFIVASLCGGTGGGILLDVAHWVKDYFGISAQVVGFLVMPSFFSGVVRSGLQKMGIRANAYAALKEINACQLGTHRFSVRYPSETAAIPRTPDTPFDNLFLVEHSGQTVARARDLLKAEERTARLIFLLSTSDQTKSILDRAASLVPESEPEGVRTVPVASFSVSVLETPWDAMVSYAEARTAALVLYRLALGPSGGPERARNSPRLAYQPLVRNLRADFQTMTGEQSLDALRKDLPRRLKRDQELPSLLVQPLVAAVRRQLREQGIEAAIELLRLVEPQAAGVTFGRLGWQDLLLKPDGSPYELAEIRAMQRSLDQISAGEKLRASLSWSKGDEAGTPAAGADHMTPREVLACQELASEAARIIRGAAFRLHDQLQELLDQVHRAYRALQSRSKQARIDFDPYPLSVECKGVTSLYDLGAGSCEADYPGSFWKLNGRAIADDVVGSILDELVRGLLDYDANLQLRALTTQGGVGEPGLEAGLLQRVELDGRVAARVREQAHLRCVYRLEHWPATSQPAAENAPGAGGANQAPASGETGDVVVFEEEENLFDFESLTRPSGSRAGVDVYWIADGRPLSTIRDIGEMHASYAESGSPPATWHVLPGAEDLPEIVKLGGVGNMREEEAP